MSTEEYSLTDGKDLFIMRRYSPIDRVKLFFYAWDSILNPNLQNGLPWEKMRCGYTGNNWAFRKDGFFGCMERAIIGYSAGTGCVENGKMVYMIVGVVAPNEVPSISYWLISLLKNLFQK